MAKLGQKSNGIYYLDVQVPDDEGGLKRSRVSCNTREKRDAEAQRRDWIAGVHPQHPSRGGVIAPKGRAAVRDTSISPPKRQTELTLVQWLDMCLSTIWSNVQIKAHASACSNVKVLTEIIDNDLLLADVSSAHLQTIAADLRKREYAEGTVKRKLQAIVAALNHAKLTEDAQGKALYVGTARKPKTAKVRPRERVLSRDEEVDVFKCLDARIEAEPGRPWLKFKMLTLVMLDTGFRLGEALACGARNVRRKRWVDPRSGEAQEAVYLHIEGIHTKSGLPREVPLTDRVIELLPLLNAGSAGGRWFPWKPKQSGAWYLWNNIREDLSKMGHDVSDVVQHTFRHTCATRLCEGGMDLVSLRDWLGHSDIAITAQNYLHLMSTHLHVGAAILNTSNGSNNVVPLRSSNGAQGAIPNSRVNGSERDEAGLARSA